MDTSESGGSTSGAAGRAVQGLLLERLAVGMVLVGLLLLVHGAVEGRGAARVAAVAVGALGVFAPLAGWRLHWPDGAMWLVLLSTMVAVFASFAWVSRG